MKKNFFLLVYLLLSGLYVQAQENTVQIDPSEFDGLSITGEDAPVQTINGQTRIVRLDSISEFVGKVHLARGCMYVYDEKTRQMAITNVTSEYRDFAREDSLYVNMPYHLSINDYPYRLTTIGERAFSKLTKLYWVTIPSNVTTIGEYAFNGCPLIRINLHGTTPISCPLNVFDPSVYETAVLTVPVGWNQEEAAKVSPVWSKFKNILYQKEFSDSGCIHIAPYSPPESQKLINLDAVIWQ